MKSIFITESSSQTRKMGEFLIKETIKITAGKRAFVLGLSGDLGGGKTTFSQGFAKGLGIKEKILSPTFIILKKYQIPNYKSQINSKFQIPNYKYFYHIDCYRIRKPKEILCLGFKEIISDPQNIVVLEWAGRIKKIMPKNTIWIQLDFIDKNKRKILIKKWPEENY